MAGENLKIRITGSLNVESTIGEIHVQLKALEKKIKPLKLKIEIDDKIMGTLNNFNKQMKAISQSALKGTALDSYSGKLNDISKQAKKSNNDQLTSADELSKGFDRLIKKAEKYNEAQKKIAETVTVSDKQGITSRTIKSNENGRVTGYTDTYNEDKMRKLQEQEKKDAQKQANQMATGREKANQKRIQDEKKLAENQAKAINKNTESEIKSNNQIIQGKAKLRQELVKLSQSGNLTSKQLAEVAKSINASKSLASLEQASQKYKELADRAKLAEQMARGRENTTVRAIQNENKAITAQSQAINRNTEATKLQQQKLLNQLKTLNQEGKVTESSLGRLNSAINSAKNIGELNKLEQAMNRVNQRSATNSNLDVFRRQAQLSVQNIQRTHGGHVDNTQIQNYLNSVNALSTRTPNLTQQMRNLNVQFREISANARSAAGATQQAGMSFGEMFSTAMTKFPVWIKL